jgi:hypothetical protein
MLQTEQELNIAIRCLPYTFRCSTIVANAVRIPVVADAVPSPAAVACAGCFRPHQWLLPVLAVPYNIPVLAAGVRTSASRGT